MLGRKQATSSRGMRRMLGGLALGALLWGASLVALQQQDMLRQEDRTRYVVPPLEAVALLATDFENLIADSYWLLFLQMNGENLTIPDPSRRDYRHAYPTLALITGLDPQFHDAALFGSWALADGERLDEARKLIASGMERHPTDYRYPYQLGVLEFLYGKRYMEAARHFERAAELPGAPPGTLRFAARMYQKDNKEALAIQTWRAIHQGSKDAQSRAIAERALKKLGVDL
jgi:tetratricopeptide (TPR) repeat protein